MTTLTLAQASIMVDTAVKDGHARKNFAPLTVAVLDAGGHLVAFKREDKSGILRFDIAFGKAWGALGMGFGSRTLFERAEEDADVLHRFWQQQAVAVSSTNPGGVLIRDANGDIIGAIGISGDTSDNDEICAIAGIAAAGLKSRSGRGEMIVVVMAGTGQA